MCKKITLNEVSQNKSTNETLKVATLNPKRTKSLPSLVKLFLELGFYPYFKLLNVMLSATQNKTKGWRYQQLSHFHPIAIHNP